MRTVTRLIKAVRHRTMFKPRALTTFTYEYHSLKAKNPGHQVGTIDFDDELFNYTRNRLVRNKRHEMSQRHIRFSVEDLSRCVTETIGHRSCVNIEKYPDDIYNKGTLLTMDDSSHVEAEILNPNAGMPSSTTASEVATMEFVLLAWSSKGKENPVGAEYIIMAKALMIAFEYVWPRMEIEDRFSVVKSIACFQKNWTFSIGPSTVGVAHSNPGRSLEQHHTTTGHREVAAVRHFSRLPQLLITLHGPGICITTRKRKYWQSMEIAPLYFHARQPYIIHDDGFQLTGALLLQHSLFHTLTHFRNLRLYTALEFRQSASYYFLSVASNLLIDGELNICSPYPLSFTDQHRQGIEVQLEGVARGMKAMSGIREGFGEPFLEQGIVRLYRYEEEALAALAWMRE
ncbi:hypothetical protein P280DRAFT_502421 [Massarina eburnea CBS 473.64]|uniref:Uncharacterized protein n=1 Tax=Massarina eburnea CBS 473.64 TaxID=1395130 RepID=A0A6A6RH05_9PLEO|nr:hypothetical protein P280DRAFT_502421 [Massarina eburnea CBS 473.64]